MNLTINNRNDLKHPERINGIEDAYTSFKETQDLIDTIPPQIMDITNQEVFSNITETIEILQKDKF